MDEWCFEVLVLQNYLFAYALKDLDPIREIEF